MIEELQLLLMKKELKEKHNGANGLKEITHKKQHTLDQPKKKE